MRGLGVGPSGRTGLSAGGGPRVLASLAVALVLVGGAAACGGSCRGSSSGPRGEGTSSASTSAPASSGAGAATPRFLALGDSFTIGTGSPREAAFPARLVAKWREQRCFVDLRNVAVNGFTTDDLIVRELPELERYQPTFVTVTIGANDIVRRRTPEAYRANLKTIFAELASLVAAGGSADGGAPSVVVIPQPDWSHSPAAASYGDPEVTAASIRTFNGILAAEAKAIGATWVDLSPLMEKQAADRMLARDGLHPSAAAYGAWADALAQAIAPPCMGVGALGRAKPTGGD